MTEKRDIYSLEDIKFLVDKFYQKVKENELLGPVFTTVIQNRWPQHLEKMYRFWETVLLEKQTYKGGPSRHMQSYPCISSILIPGWTFGSKPLMSILKGQLPKKLNGEQIKWQKCLFLK